jgi:fructose-1,6-bisphosphatase/inositol monophosphatase family enzyme
MYVLIEHAHRVRIIGVGSLGLCFCAEGGFDAYVNLGSTWKHHDIAAGEIIVREAGGEFYYVGKQGKQIVSGPAALCNEIREALKI